jgi:replicative DNA helicase
MDRITADDVFEAEKTVLACILAANELIAECGLEWSDFVEGLHQTIFDKASELAAGHQHVNPVSLKPFLPRSIDKLPFAPSEYVENLFLIGSSPARKAQFEASLQIIKGMALARQLAREADFATTLATEGHTLLTLGDEIEQLENRLKGIRVRFTEIVDSKRPGDAYLEFFNSTSRNGGTIGVPIAIPAIRKAIGEDVFAAGNIYGLLGASGEGKTATTMQLIYGAILCGHPVQFLSYDQSPSQCVRQMIAQVHSIDTKQQNDPDRLMTQHERDKCMLFIEWLNHQPFEIIRCRREGITRLLTYSKRFIKRHKNGKTPLIVIDHILKIKPRDERASPDIRSSDINMEAKAFADEEQAAALILNQRNGQGGYRLNPRPIGKDLYGGEGAKQDYDAVAYVYRPQHWRDEMLATAADEKDRMKINAVFSEFGANVDELAEFGALKARFGPRGIREWEKFEGRYTRFCPLIPEREKELF